MTARFGRAFLRVMSHVGRRSYAVHRRKPRWHRTSPLAHHSGAVVAMSMNDHRSLSGRSAGSLRPDNIIS